MLLRNAMLNTFGIHTVSVIVSVGVPSAHPTHINESSEVWLASLLETLSEGEQLLALRHRGIEA